MTNRRTFLLTTMRIAARALPDATDLGRLRLASMLFGTTAIVLAAASSARAHADSAVVKAGSQVKVSAKSRGENAAKIDLLAGSISPSGLITVLTMKNAADGFVHRMCTRFSDDIVVTPVGGGTGRKLVAKGGIPTACP